jgi:5-methylcytosine-specific restriction endonuclease McrA
MAAIVRAYKSTPEGREKTRALKKRQQSTEEYKARRLVRLQKPRVRDRRRKLALVSNARYRKTEKGKVTMARVKARRREREAALESSLTVAEWEQIKEKQKGKCYWCQKPAKLQMDHVTPVAKGGAFTKENIVGACGPCNKKKGAKMLTLF